MLKQSGVLSGAFGLMSSKVNTITEIQKVRDEISNKIIDIGKKVNDSASAEAWVELMLVLGQKARIVQNDTRNISHSCEMLHAMRSYIYLTLLTSKIGTDAILQKVNELTLQMEIKEKNIKDIPSDLPNRYTKVNVLREEYNRVLRNRTYLYVVTLQGKAEIELIFRYWNIRR